MNIREQFGKYLLLKKLAEDPLGETFRAGRVGNHGMEQVVLLRAFNGTGLDGAALTAALQKRKAVHQALVSPNVGNGVDLGEVRGVPFIAYDYISGKDLAALQEQAKRRNHPIPSDHALLIAERVALALAVGYETRLEDERVLHGCLLPQLVMISNEGETRLYVECDDKQQPVAPLLVESFETMERDDEGRAETGPKDEHDKSDPPCALGYGLWPFEKMSAAGLREQIKKGLEA
jgi:hypothetical protein